MKKLSMFPTSDQRATRSFSPQKLEVYKALIELCCYLDCRWTGKFHRLQLDAADNNDYMTNINLPFPFPDAVAQFSVETTDLGAAQSGLHPGGLVNVPT
jgi:hypothetical protein